ncbi:hypothetical protein [Chlorogloea sp. CCALA 695]
MSKTSAVGGRDRIPTSYRTKSKESALSRYDGKRQDSKAISVAVLPK